MQLRDFERIFLESVSCCIFINVYTFTNPEIAEILAEAEEKGIDVIILVEKSPAGGMKDEEKAILSFLSNKGVKVYLSDGSFRYNHAKYIIKDNSSVLVMTENFGYGGFSPYRIGNRGWGAIIKSNELAEFFLSLFFDDLRQALPYMGNASFKSLKNRLRKNSASSLLFIMAPHPRFPIL